MFIPSEQEGGGLHGGLKSCYVHGMILTFSNDSDACLINFQECKEMSKSLIVLSRWVYLLG